MKSLFGRKKAPPQGNPYAQQQTENEYERMTPYQRSRPDLDNNNAPPRPSVAGGLPSGPGPRRGYNASPSQSAQSFGGSTYVEPPSQGYGSNRYGSNQGYGSSRFDSNSTAFSVNQAAPPPRASGYGGLGGRPQDFADNGYARKPQPPGGSPNRYAAGGNEPYPDEDENDYANEELTEEELVERECRKIEFEQKNVRRDNVSTLHRITAMADEADEKASNTLANLASQGERLNRVEQNLQVSAAHARHAEAKTKELKHANRSIFSLSVQNPMTKRSRERDHENAILQQSRQEREEKANIRKAGYREKQDFENFMKSTEEPEDVVNWPGKASSDSEEEDTAAAVLKEEEKTATKAALQALKKVNAKARFMRTMIDEQNDSIDRISAKTDGVGDAVVKNSAKLRAFK